ncbi:MAG TPA: DUF1800 domain-containing protein [Acidimicrobiales bacterium]|nr:DUF1800 domain-containing protein [Acidimicrobiales bacterium]
MAVRDDLAHLFRRAAFGASAAELDAAEQAGYEATVDRLLALDSPDGPGDAIPAPVFPPLPSKDDARAAVQWWLRRMAATAVPLREKIALFWHGHFATSIEKVKSAALMVAQNEVLRRQGAGDFGELTLAVAKDPAMLVWLDSNTNKVGHPNENFARELMELFTLGIGQYSESDVREAARCFTGWTFDRRSGSFVFRPGQHDNGVKTVLGSTGNLAGEDVIRLATTHPASARFVAAKVWSHFAYPVAVDDPVLDPLVAAYGSSLDVAALLRATFLAPEFLSDAARNGLVKQPVEYVVGAARALGVDAGGAEVVPVLNQLGQVPFAPPSVGGWPQNGYWLSTATAAARARFAARLVAAADLSAVASATPAARVEAVARLLSVVWTPPTRDALAAVAADPKAVVRLALVSPEYVVA